jgi:hypothetical protein
MVWFYRCWRSVRRLLSAGKGFMVVQARGWLLFMVAPLPVLSVYRGAVRVCRVPHPPAPGIQPIEGGTVLDPGGFTLSSGAETLKGRPVVTFGGSQC